jgi:transcriptional regulator with XRE-family HTH domain
MESGHNAERYVFARPLISSIEHGHANPTLESLDKVASALDVAVADLLA